MKPPKTVYRGERLPGGVAVTADGEPFDPRRSQAAQYHAGGFEWGYAGAGPNQLALAILLDVLGDAGRARRWVSWFMWWGPACWGERWEVTAAEVLAAVKSFEGSHAQMAAAAARATAGRPRRCRVCSCTDDDCGPCVAAAGRPCHWVDADLCSRCSEELYGSPVRLAEGGAP